MGILDSLLGGLTGEETSESTTNSDFTPPTSICRSDCGIAPDACSLCKPYKEKLIDALYYVDHLDEFEAKYEVVGAESAAGGVKCPYCGGMSENPDVCEYCGSKLSDSDSAKIRVASASDIPDPIITARDIIYDRHIAIAQKYGDTEDESLSGILSGIKSLLLGSSEEETNNATSELGARLSRDEIVEAAASKGVSVSSYLKGLDAGTYLTPAQEKAQRESASSGSTGSTLLSGLGALGTGAAAASVIGSLVGNKTSSNNRRNDMPPMNSGGGNRGGQRNSGMSGNRGGQGGFGGGPGMSGGRGGQGGFGGGPGMSGGRGGQGGFGGGPGMGGGHGGPGGRH